jgi:acid phosphatase type 7
MTNTLRAANTFDSANRFFIFGGDLVNEMGKNPSEIISYTNAAHEFNLTRPVVATQGNHDTYYDNGTNDQYRFGEATVFNAFITFPDNGRDSHPDKAIRSQSYYFYYNKVLFIMLNTMATKNDSGPHDPDYTEQKEWLIDVLENDRANGLSRYTIVFTHISPFGGQTVARYMVEPVRAAFGKILTDYGVDILFAGHDHVYGRSIPMKIEDPNIDEIIKSLASGPAPGGTVFSIVGATGPKFYNIGSDDRIGKYFTVKSDNITPGMFVNVKVTANKLTITGRRTGGGQVDLYEVLAK